MTEDARPALPPRLRSSLRVRARVGALFGLILGGLYCVVATLLLLFRAGFLDEPGPALLFSARLTIGYLIGWAGAGAIGGAMFPISQWILGRMAIGFVAMLPVTASMFWVLPGFGGGPLWVPDLGDIVRFSAMSGPLFGLVTWFAVPPQTATSKRTLLK